MASHEYPHSILFCGLASLLLATTSAYGQSQVSADVGFLPSSIVAPNPALPGSQVQFTAIAGNFGPTSSFAPVTVTGTLPPEFIPNFCIAFAPPFTHVPCAINGATVTATFDFSLQKPDPLNGIDAVDVTIVGTLSPNAPTGGAQFPATFTVSAPSPDPNPANNSVTLTLFTPSPIVAAVNPAQPDFGFTPLNYNAPPLEITLTNAGKSPFLFLGNLPGGITIDLVGVPPVTGPFAWNDTVCTGPQGTFQIEAFPWFLMPGATCTIHASFTPTSLGPASGTMTFVEFQEGTGQFAQQVVPLTGAGSNVGLFPRNLEFPLTVDATTSAAQSAQLVNTGPATVPITSIATTGNFSKTDDCGGVVQPQSSCSLFVRFAPTVAGPATGSLTVTDSDVGSPLAVNLSGTGTAVKLSPGPDQAIGFQDAAGGISPPQTITLTDASTQPLDLGAMTITGDFSEHDDCPSKLSSGQSCTISVFYKPAQDGPSKGTLTLAEDDVSTPQTFQLIGTGVGTANGVIFLHYDYMVGPDHTHDPEVLAPGAIQEVIRRFAAHGITLIIDPRHTAIRETAPPANVFPYFSTIVFGNGDCGGAQGFVNFYDLKAAYFQGKNSRTHYTIFGHAIADASTSDEFNCSPFFFTGLAELPGQNFVIALGGLDFGSEISASLQRRIVAGVFMHEFGHNLGLHHGGGIGVLDADDTNFKPNYVSIMSYNYVFHGIPEADAVGSTHQRSCDRDSDCGAGASCIDVGLKPGPPSNVCLRLDYSRQLLPTGGNTPGALKETDLSEPAGLGSGNADIIFFPTRNCTDIQIAASNGPVDWDSDGSATNLHAQANLLMDVLFLRCSSPLTTVHGFDDWKALTGNLEATEALNEANSGAPQPVAPELDMETIRQNHLLYPLRPAQIAIHPGCGLSSAPLAPGQPGTITIAIPGAGSLDVTQIDVSSLTLHGLQPLSTTIRDANLIATFDMAQLELGPQTKEVLMTGWLKNGQRFSASASISVVSDMNSQPQECRN